MLAQEIKGRGGFLCDEMGLGKTAQTIGTMVGNPQNRTLIIVPKSVMYQWKEEITRFAPKLGQHVMMYEGPSRDALDFSREKYITIAPYSLLTNRKSKNTVGGTALHAIQWDRIILDEGHEIRNRTSKVHKSAIELRGKIKWIVTGTPVFNSMKDFVALCGFIGIPRVLVQQDPAKIRNQYILRRTKADV